MGERLTLENIIGKLKIMNPNIEIMSKEYINPKTKLKCRCNIDGCEWETFWSNLRNGKGCPKCGGSLRLTLEEVIDKINIISPNIQILSDVYINADTNLKCKCIIDGNEWDADWHHLQRGHGCPVCGGSIRLTMEKAKENINKTSPNIEILSDIYINAETELQCRCKIHGSIWLTNYRNLYTGMGCPECHIDKITGENSHMWKGGITELKHHLRGKILQWKYDSFNKYKSKCDITNSREKCQVHHLHNFSDIVRETLEISNLPLHTKIGDYTMVELNLINDTCIELHYKYGLGICLCEKEHKLFHSIYTEFNNTKEQYDNFKAMRLDQIGDNNIRNKGDFK